MMIRQADSEDVADLARLLWLDTFSPALDLRGVESFVVELADWWASHRDSHFAFVARTSETVGVAWVAILPRVPRPGVPVRRCGDIQSVFVMPSHRGQGIGAALVEAASKHAEVLGAARVTVHSGRKAVPVYERLGFVSTRQLLQRTPGSS